MSMPQPHSITLETDPNTLLSVSFLRGSESAPLIVFLNGLVKPAASFDTSITQFLSLVAQHDQQPWILKWDRYGQGLSGRQEQDHDAKDVIRTMRQILEHFIPDRVNDQKLILVGNSIGCPLARMYASQYPGVKGLLFLDSMMAHSDFVSIFQSRLNTDKEEERILAKTKEIVAKIFAPNVPNAERFNRLHLKEDVPYSDQPVLPDQPWITVLGHDPIVFAKDSEEKLGIPASIIDKYLNTEWKRYNEGLIKLTTSSRARGPIIVEGSDHFIQLTRPDRVAEELKILWDKILTTK